MAYEYSWAQNQMKLARAITAVKDRIKAGEKVADFEEEVKSEYVKYLGVVLDVDAIAKKAASEADEAKDKADEAAAEAAKAAKKAEKEAAKAAKKNDK